MTATTLTPEDLEPFATIEPAKAEAMIADVLGMAKHLAPCIFEYEFDNPEAAKAILRQAVLRWNEAGSGATQQLTALGFSQSFTQQPRYGIFLKSEIEQLQAMCDTRKGGAFSIDTAPYETPVHSDVCDLVFGGESCSCGADLTGSLPLWETQQ